MRPPELSTAVSDGGRAGWSPATMNGPTRGKAWLPVRATLIRSTDRRGALLVCAKSRRWLGFAHTATPCPAGSTNRHPQPATETRSDGVMVPVAGVGVVRVVGIGVDRVLVRIVRIRMRLAGQRMAAGPVVVV